MFNFLKPKATITAGFTTRKGSLEYLLNAKDAQGKLIAQASAYCSPHELEKAAQILKKAVEAKGYAVTLKVDI